MNISLFMLLAQFLVKKIFLKSAGVLIFFRRKRCTGMSLSSNDPPKKLSPPHQDISNDRSLMSKTTEVIINLELQVLRHLVVKFDLERLGRIFFPQPRSNVGISISSTPQTTAPTQH